MSGVRTWTPEQKQAIYARGGALLLSAAAGSGKTAVLVERVIQMVCDAKNPCPIDRLLMVTFTKAAAAEMRERIGKALSERLAKDPGNAYLLRQQMLLPVADICTMDSFCNALVKQYFHELNIPPDFRMLEDSERRALEDEVVSACLQDLYQEDSEVFRKIAGLFLLGTSDQLLKETVLSLYHYAQAYPFPARWLAEIPKLYASNLRPQQTAWGERILANVCMQAEENLRVLRKGERMLQNEEALLAAYAPALQSDILQNTQLLAAAQEKNWDEAKRLVETYAPERLKSAPKEYRDSVLKDTVYALRNKAKKALQELSKIFPASEAEFSKDSAFLQPVIALLSKTVLQFSDALALAKKEESAYDFNDISHMALQILVTVQEDGTVQKTETAKALALKYIEILLDEYQDTNEAQELLFSAISKDETNLFAVGDIKQSIYAFRLAMPEIFMRRRAAYADYNGVDYPARISLHRNFRSRKTVANGINYLFGQWMTEEVGGIDYNGTEMLNPAADFEETADFPLELHILPLTVCDTGDALPEAVYIAERIRDMLTSEMQVTDKSGQRRPVQYGDICILMRSLSNGDKYREALENAGIPAFYQKKGGFFAMSEVRLMIALLQILNNPFLDVPLCACLLSPLWGFTPDELSEIKLQGQGESFFQKLLSVETEKSKQFLEAYNRLHALSTALPPDVLLQTIFEKTGYLSIAGAMPGGENRKLNLLLLLRYAQEYTEKGKNSLSGFLRYLEKLQSNESNVEAATGVSEYANVVRIMTIHKSKGLEFPVVIIAKCGSAFNRRDQMQKMLIHPKLKIGLKVYDVAGRRTFDSVPYIGTKLAMAADAQAEELRVLYVAMTRAKERLLFVGSGSAQRSAEGMVKKAAFAVLGESGVPPQFVQTAACYLELLCAALVKHPDASLLREIGETDAHKKETADFALRIYWGGAEQTESAVAENVQQAQPSAEWLAKIDARVRYVYPNLPLQACPAKITASALNAQGEDFEHFACARPAFLGKSGLTPAMRGTATHRFVEICDFAAAKTDLEAEMQRLCACGLLEQEACDALDRPAIQAFLQSALLARMQQADALYREQKFTVLFPATDVVAALDASFSNEQIMVQGIIDCLFLEKGKLVVVDYKTDRVQDANVLAERYRKQLQVYKRAAQEMFAGLPVETLLYSFYLKKEIPVNI